MFKSFYPLIAFILLVFIISALPLHAQERIELDADSTDTFVIDPADFDPDDKDAKILRYEPFGNKKEAVYKPDTKDDGTPVIQAVSENAISTVTTPLKADPNSFQYLHWEWKIESVLESGDLTEKDGDDFAARIYVTFDYPASKLPFGQKIKYRLYKTFTSFDIPLRSLNYVWASSEEVGTIAESPFTSWVQYIVVQSGNDQAGEWVSNKRNILEDYREAFGEDPPEISGITIMTDSDNTGESTKAWFGKIILSKE